MLENYEVIQTINDEHRIYLVKNILDTSFYVKKELSVYDIDIYNYLFKHHFKGIPYIKEFTEIDNKLIVIEEYVSGSSIETILNNKLFTENEVKDIVIKLCLILKDLSNGCNFVHRDIKPSNLILKDNNELYLIDFNAAKFSGNKNRDTVLLGTEGYAAPEQYGFGESNVQSDIYAIGVLMKEMLTGTNELNSNYESKLKPVINKCTRLDPELRYQSYEKLIEAIDNKYHYSKYNKYLPVGFRSRKWWAMILATSWYLLIIFMGTGLTVTNGNESAEGMILITDRIGIIVTLISMTLFTGNYLNCHKFFKVNPKWNLFIKIIYIFFVDAILFLFGLLITLIIGEMI